MCTPLPYPPVNVHYMTYYSCLTHVNCLPYNLSIRFAILKYRRQLAIYANHVLSVEEQI